MADVYPPDPASPIGQVRYLINDAEQWDYDGTGEGRYRMPDAQLQAFIAMSRDRLYAAGAHALRALAANEVLISKVIRTEDLQTDGAKVGTELRLLARDLDGRQNQDDEDTAMETAFDIVNVNYPYDNMEW